MRQFPIGFDAPAKLAPVDALHHHVGDNQVHARFFKDLKRARAVFGPQHFQALVLKNPRRQVQGVSIVVHGQDDFSNGGSFILAHFTLRFADPQESGSVPGENLANRGPILIIELL